MGRQDPGRSRAGSSDVARPAPRTGGSSVQCSAVHAPTIRADQPAESLTHHDSSPTYCALALPGEVRYCACKLAGLLPPTSGSVGELAGKSAATSGWRSSMVE